MRPGLAEGSGALSTTAPAIPRGQLSLGIVCPMANEEKSAADLVAQVLEATRDFGEVRFYAVLDRVSKDRTRQVLEQLAAAETRLKVVWAPENRCVVDAYLRGYTEAIAGGHDYILEMDAGFSHRPADLPAFFRALDSGYDCIFGSRFVPGGGIRDTPWHRRFISHGGSILANVLLGTRLHDMTSGFELFSRRALIEILEQGIRSRAHFFQTEIKYHARKMRIVEVPIQYSAASPNVGSESLRDAFQNLLRLVRLRWKRP
ncbi:MAG TPA: glycosyltransferase [Bryobacteraceae bacterium]|nr:glycosyltransferase [Bryobacteraceae bacterium]